MPAAWHSRAPGCETLQSNSPKQQGCCLAGRRILLLMLPLLQHILAFAWTWPGGSTTTPCLPVSLPSVATGAVRVINCVDRCLRSAFNCAGVNFLFISLMRGLEAALVMPCTAHEEETHSSFASCSSQHGKSAKS